MASNYNCLLLDVDGTLLDFAAAEREAILATLDACGLPATEEAAAQYTAINAELWAQLEKGELKKDQLVTQRFATLLGHMGAEGDPIRLNNEYLTRLSASATPYPGAEELLSELAEFATLAAVTNGTYTAQMSRLEKSGLLPYLDEVFVSEKMGSNKPVPKIFNEALRRLGIRNKSRVLVVGDSLTADIQGGQNAGLDTCWCNFTGAEDSTGPQPTYTAHSYTELKLIAVGKEELELAANREKRHQPVQ